MLRKLFHSWHTLQASKFRRHDLAKLLLKYRKCRSTSCFINISMKYFFVNEHNRRALCSIKFSHFLRTGCQNRFLFLINNKKKKFSGKIGKKFKNSSRVTKVREAIGLLFLHWKESQMPIKSTRILIVYF